MLGHVLREERFGRRPDGLTTLLAFLLPDGFAVAGLKAHALVALDLLCGLLRRLRRRCLVAAPIEDEVVMVELPDQVNAHFRM